MENKIWVFKTFKKWFTFNNDQQNRDDTDSLKIKQILNTNQLYVTIMAKRFGIDILL